MTIRFLIITLFAAILLVFLPFLSKAQDAQPLALTADALADGKPVALDKLPWKFQAGDDPAWANPSFDDSGWKILEQSVIKPESFPGSDWDGRAWFRLHFTSDDSLTNKDLALIMTQTGASEIYLDGRRIAEFGAINETGEYEFNPSGLPVVFRLETPGEHVLAVRSSNSVFADRDGWRARWLINGEIYPKFTASVELAADSSATILRYANRASMRMGFLFIGVLLALAFLHFLLYIFYRTDRANLFYSIYALAFALNVLTGNLRFAGHQGVTANGVLRVISMLTIAAMFVSLVAFLRTAFETKLGRIFWLISVFWLISLVLSASYIVDPDTSSLLGNFAIFLSFSYSIFLVAKALRYRRQDAWIILIGVQIFALGMISILVRQFSLLNLPEWVYEIGEFAMILAFPVAVSIFLARSVARTNRDLKTQLEQVETLSVQKIEQERRAAELHAENERRAKELDEARQLQISMLPKKLPVIAGLEIAAYMKPATEVGGDYYDFHVSEDGTLTVAVGDATGHGLKAGTVVTATKGLFNNLAPSPDIPDTLQQISRSLKAMNLRGLFMAMTLLKIKNNRLSISAAGMPSTLLYRHSTGTVEKIDLRALPLGGIAGINYKKQEFELAPNDLIVLMSDGFPEMFNANGEMLGDEEAGKILQEAANLSPQEIIDRLIISAENWADGRAADDDVTFVIIKID